MKRFNSKIIITYLLIILYLLVSFIFSDDLGETFTYIINPIIWLIIMLVSILLIGKEDAKFKGNKDKTQIVLIGTLIFIILFFASGLIFTFAKSSYSRTAIGILKNLFAFVGLIVFKEITRSKLVTNTGKVSFNLAIICILFIACDIQIYNLTSYLSSSEMFFKYFFSQIFPIISVNIVCTYLATVSNSLSSILYRGIIMTAKIIAPILPNLDWFMQGMMEGLFPVIIYAMTNYYNVKRTQKLSKKSVKKNKPYKLIILVIIFVLFGFFVGGFFSYRPVAVMSGSMQPLFYRGDVVLVKKINEENVKNLKIYDIIEYKLDSRVVLHRIIKIEEENGELYFTTKGDNNELEDTKRVTKDQVIGTIEGTIKYIGYPSVLLYDYFNK